MKEDEKNEQEQETEPGTEKSPDCSQQPERKKSCISGITVTLYGDTGKQQLE